MEQSEGVWGKLAARLYSFTQATGRGMRDRRGYLERRGISERHTLPYGRQVHCGEY